MQGSWQPHERAFLPKELGTWSRDLANSGARVGPQWCLLAATQLGQRCEVPSASPWAAERTDSLGVGKTQEARSPGHTIVKNGISLFGGKRRTRTSPTSKRLCTATASRTPGVPERWGLCAGENGKFRALRVCISAIIHP